MPVVLEDWQKDMIFSPLFEIDPDTGLRKYTLALIGMPQTVFDFLDNLHNYIGSYGIWLFDRGFDSKAHMEKLLSLKVKFIMRIKINRDVFIDGKKKSLKSIFDEAEYPYNTIIRMKRKPRLIELNFREIKILGIKEKLWLVFTKSVYGETYILLTNIKVENFDDAKQILRTYRYRWSVEDFFRVMKQDIGIEKIMVRTLRRINKLIEIAMLPRFMLLATFIQTPLTVFGVF